MNVVTMVPGVEDAAVNVVNVDSGFVSSGLRVEPMEVKADAVVVPGSLRELGDEIVQILAEEKVDAVVVIVGFIERVDRGVVAEYRDLKTDSYRGYDEGVATGLVAEEVGVPLCGGGVDTGGCKWSTPKPGEIWDNVKSKCSIGVVVKVAGKLVGTVGQGVVVTEGLGSAEEFSLEAALL